MNPPDRPPNASSLALQIACWGGLLVLAISYGILIPMKAQGMLPAEMTYVGIVAGPALMIGLIVGPLLAERWFPKTSTKWILGICIVVATFGLILIWITKG